jgi:hypothetical protein
LALHTNKHTPFMIFAHGETYTLYDFHLQENTPENIVKRLVWLCSPMCILLSVLNLFFYSTNYAMVLRANKHTPFMIFTFRRTHWKTSLKGCVMLCALRMGEAKTKLLFGLLVLNCARDNKLIIYICKIHINYFY